MNSVSMSVAELKAALSLASVFFLRMLPLFMVLPVLSLSENTYMYATPQLLGLALGIYGLTQASLQIPFGMLSDRWGRKPIIVLGLIIFGIGSLIAATADSVHGLLIGRALQGAGAVAAALMALAADLTRKECRTKAMACIGISIGAAFSIAFILGPILYAYIGIKGLFYLSACLSILAIITLLTIVPTPTKKVQNANPPNLRDIKSVLVNTSLVKLDISIFSSHLILMANFVAIPITLRDSMQLATISHWQVYLTAIFASLFIMVPFIMFGERLKKENLFLILSILLIMLSQIGLALFGLSLNFIIIFLILFILSPITYLYVSITQTDKRTDYPGKEIAQMVQKSWDKKFDSKITYVSGDEWVAGNLSYHLKSRPIWVGVSVEVKSKDKLSIVDVYENSISEAVSKIGYFKVYGE